MNEPTNELLSKLELATAPSPDPQKLDDETAMLRESWLALGRLLDAADRQGGVEGSGFRVQGSEGRVQGSGGRVQGSGDRGRGSGVRVGRRWRLAMAGVLAATLLVAAVGTWLVFPSLPDGRGPKPEQIVTPSGGGAELAPHQNRMLPVNTHPTWGDFDELAWDDTVDEQLAQAGQAIAGVRALWRRDDAAFDFVRGSLQRIEQEIQQDSL